MWLRSLTEEEEELYTFLTIYEHFQVRVKNEIFEEIRDELNSVLIAAKLLDYNIDLSYAKSGVTCNLDFRDHEESKTIFLIFNCQNDIRELDYITLQIRFENSHSGIIVNGCREGFELSGNSTYNITFKDLCEPLRKIKESF